MQLQNWRRNGITLLEDGEFYEKEKMSRVSKLTLSSPNISSKERHTLNSGRSHSRMSTPTDSKLKRRNISADPLDISDAPDYNLLSDGEKLLCQELRIYPKPYLCIKELLFKELLNSGGVLNQEKVGSIIKLEPSKTSRIYHYFVKQKWCQVS